MFQSPSSSTNNRTEELHKLLLELKGNVPEKIQLIEYLLSIKNNIAPLRESVKNIPEQALSLLEGILKILDKFKADNKQSTTRGDDCVDSGSAQEPLTENQIALLEEFLSILKPETSFSFKP